MERGGKMIDKKLQKALNDQLNAELYSAYLYLSMSAYFQTTNLPGCTNWMFVQAQEEQSHAMKFYDYLGRRGGRIELKAIDAPPTEWSSPRDVFEAVYKHEQKVTGLIKVLMELATEQKDDDARTFLQWFVDEQVEEEESADEVLQKLKLTDYKSQELYMIDRKLAKRVFKPPKG
jgi:ferritin